jgi:hypothetical protein
MVGRVRYIFRIKIQIDTFYGFLEDCLCRGCMLVQYLAMKLFKITNIKGTKAILLYFISF